MKKRTLASLMAVMLTAGMLVPSAQAIDIHSRGHQFVLAPFADGSYFNSFGDEVEYTAGTSLGACRTAKSFQDVYTIFEDPAANKTIAKYYDSADPETRKCAFGKESSFAMMIADSKSTEHSLESKLEVNGRYAQVGTYKVFKTVTLNLKNGLSVENGGLLLQNTFNGNVNSQQTQQQKLVVQLGKPAEVGANGRLILDGTDNVTVGLVASPPSELIAPDGQSAIIIKNGGTVEIANFEVKRSANDTSAASLIQVEDGGELRFFASASMEFDENGMPVYNPNLENPEVKVELDNGASGTPAVSVADGATVTVEAGDFTASGTGPIFDLASGGKLTLEGGTIENSGGKPAITVGSGAAVVIPEGSKASITSTNGTTAIDLADGSTIQKGGNTITVGTNPADDGTSDNYVDNLGNIILGSGGSVTDSSGTTTDLPNGGTVTPEGEVKPTPGPPPPPPPPPRNNPPPPPAPA